MMASGIIKGDCIRCGELIWEDESYKPHKCEPQELENVRQLISHPAWLVLLERAIERHPHESIGVSLETLEDLRDRLIKVVEGVSE